MNLFISYEKADSPLVSQLRESLWSFGISPVEANLKRALGTDILTRLRQALPNIDYVILCLSKSYLETPWFRSEMSAFVGLEMAAGYNLIIPILVEKCDVPDIFQKRICADLSGSFEEGYERLLAYITGIRQVFVVMTFGDQDLDSAYDGAIQLVAREFKYTARRVDEIQDSGNINVQMLREIARSEIVVADLTHDRPNCYYEVGYAQALGKEVILTKRKNSGNPHFDLAGNRFIFWGTEKELREQLRERFIGIRDRAKKSSELSGENTGILHQPLSSGQAPNKSASPDG